METNYFEMYDEKKNLITNEKSFIKHFKLNFYKELLPIIFYMFYKWVAFMY